MMRVNRSSKAGVQSVPFFVLIEGKNHSTSTVKVLKASTCAACLSNNAVWTVRWVPLLASMPDVGGLGGGG